MHELKISNVSIELEKLVDSITNEDRCKVIKKEWRSKYNSSVVYDYEPFCAEGFYITYTISSPDENKLRFVKYIYDKYIKTIESLQSNLEIKIPEKVV